MGDSLSGGSVGGITPSHGVPWLSDKEGLRFLDVNLKETCGPFFRGPISGSVSYQNGSKKGSLIAFHFPIELLQTGSKKGP